MKGYAGIDIGTTNSKVLVIGESGEILLERTRATPRTVQQGLQFFDLSAIDAMVDDFTAAARELCTLQGLGFSTIGESVVPVRQGRALSNPALWDEFRITASESETEIFKRHSEFEALGIVPNGLLSIDKILWMRRNMRETREAEFWLPLSSYQCYRKTGSPCWDFSQGNRSGLFHIHNREWIPSLLAAFNLSAPGTLAPMGTNMGERDGLVYGLGGHDHIVGLFGVRHLFGSMDIPFLYDSMGTAAVLALAAHETGNCFHGLGTGSLRGGSIKPDAEPGSYIITRSFRRFGGLLKAQMKLGGFKADTPSFREINQKITEEKPGLDCLLACNGDFLLGHREKQGAIWFDVQPEMTIAGLIHSVYTYLAIGTAIIRDELLSVSPVQRGEYQFVAGGGSTENTLLMDYLAAALEHEIILLGGIREISALGAAVAAMVARDDQTALSTLRSRLLEQSLRYPPKPDLAPTMTEARERYKTLGMKLISID